MLCLFLANILAVNYNFLIIFSCITVWMVGGPRIESCRQLSKIRFLHSNLIVKGKGLCFSFLDYDSSLFHDMGYQFDLT